MSADEATLPLVDGWSRLYPDDNPTAYYYHHESTGKTVWEYHVTLQDIPKGWGIYSDTSGSTYYVQEGTNKTVWTLQETLLEVSASDTETTNKIEDEDQIHVFNNEDVAPKSTKLATAPRAASSTRAARVRRLSQLGMKSTAAALPQKIPLPASPPPPSAPSAAPSATSSVAPSTAPPPSVPASTGASGKSSNTRAARVRRLSQRGVKKPAASQPPRKVPPPVAPLPPTNNQIPPPRTPRDPPPSNQHKDLRRHSLSVSMQDVTQNKPHKPSIEQRVAPRPRHRASTTAIVEPKDHSLTKKNSSVFHRLRSKTTGSNGRRSSVASSDKPARGPGIRRLSQTRVLVAVPGLSEFEHKPLRIEVVSWNVGNKQPDEKELEKLVCPWRYSGEANASQPDVIVVGTQECKYKQDKNTLDAKSLHKKIENKKIQEHKTEGSSDAAAVAAAVAAAEIDSGHSHWVNMLTMVVGTDYHIVSKEHLLEMRLVVFAKSNVLNKVTGVSHKHKATGIAHVYGNKGGLVSAIRFGGTGFSGVVLVVVLNCFVRFNVLI